MKVKSISPKLISILFLVVFMAGMTFTGCLLFSDARAPEGGVGSFEKAESTESIMLEEAPAMEMAEELVEEELMVSDAETQYSDTPVPVDRKVIKTAYIELEVEEGKFENILFRLTALAEQNGGFISNTQSYSDPDGNLTSGRITIRIPHDQYNSAIDKIKNMGTVKSISISGQDVTQEYTDLESRLRNLEAQQEILLDLMKQSKNVSDSIEVQRELSYVQGEIEVIKGRMNYLDNMVSFSTIEIYLFEPEPIRTVPGWGFLEAIKRGLRGAVNVFNGMVVFLMVTSPVWILIVIILIIIWSVIRARRRRRAKKE